MIGVFTRTIPRRILAALLCIYLTTYLATALVVYSGVRSSILESQRQSLGQIADAKYSQLNHAIAALATDLSAWSKLDVMNDLVSGDIDKRVTMALEELKAQYDLAGDIYAFDASGTLIASSRRDIERNPLPAEWRRRGSRLVLVGKEKDPMSGAPVVALEIPVFARFDPAMRTGTLVMTYPWTAVEKLLFGLDTGTILVDRANGGRVLAADPTSLVGRVGGLVSSGPGEGGFVIGRSVSRGGLIANWQVVTVLDADSATRPIRWVALQLALLGAFLGIPIVILGRWLSRKLTAPIAQLTRVIGDIADTDRLEARAPIPASEELATLAHSFNRMTENLQRATRERERVLRDLAALNQSLEAKIADRTRELEAAVQAQQRLIADISHEIKSPLARLSMALGLARRGDAAAQPRQFDRIEREIASISALATELLTLARVESATSPRDFANVDLCDLVDQIVSDAVFERPERRSDVAFTTPEKPVVVFGSADQLRRAIENVIRNALFYSPPGARVEVAVRTTDAGEAEVTVADHGPGVPPEALAHLFEPFYRVDEARARTTGGAGVGLTICHRVVQLHGGTVKAAHNQPRGLVVRITLPRA